MTLMADQLTSASWAQLEGQYCKSIFFITSKAPPFSSPPHKQKAWQQYQLYMQEANKGIYFTTNSLIEGCWIGQISIIKGQQNSLVQPLKSNLIGLELGKLLDLSRHLDGLNPREDVCCRLDKMTRCCSQNMTLRELSVVNFDNARQDWGMIQPHCRCR